MTTEPPRFTTTRWSRILQAGDPSAPDALEAFALLAESYWRPVYCFIRHSGFGVEDAQDLTQDFFATVLEKGYLSSVDPEHWRFRTFLRVATRRFLSDQRDHDRAQKRGGDRRRIAMDVAQAEAALPQGDPETAFRKEWARGVFAAALERFKAEERPEWVQVFRRFYGVGAANQSYAEIAREVGVSESDIANYLHRARGRFREILLEELREGVAREEDVAEELRDLFESL